MPTTSSGETDGKPLAVVEAKKTTVDPGKLGSSKRKLYADCLEAMHQ